MDSPTPSSTKASLTNSSIAKWPRWRGFRRYHSGSELKRNLGEDDDERKSPLGRKWGRPAPHERGKSETTACKAKRRVSKASDRKARLCGPWRSDRVLLVKTKIRREHCSQLV